jgi:hypothetical protein
MHLKEIELCDVPEFARGLDLRGPRVGDEVQTFSAENRLGAPNFFRPYPITGWEEPYIGEESIKAPALP